jgi:hypothetical protein
LNLFPAPNYVDANPTRVFQWNYFSAASGGYPRRTEVARIDYSPATNWQIYGRVSNNSDEQHTPYTTWVNGSLNFPLTPIVFNQPGKGATIHLQNTITPTMFNELVAGVSQNTLTFYPENLDAVNRDKLGIDIPQRNPALNPLRMIPNMTFGGITNAANPSMNDGTPYFNRNTIFQLNDQLSKVAGNHTFKAGVSFERTQKFQTASSVTRGTIKFDRDVNNALDANNAYANALLGNYDTYAEATSRPQGSYLFTNLEMFAQDTWRARRNLSLDYGVRVYHDPPQYDTRHQLASFSPSLYSAANAPVLLRPGFDANRVKVAVDPRSGKTYPSGLIGAYAPGYGDPAVGSFVGGKDGYPEGLYSIPALSFAPRIGFAWDPLGTGRTSIRGGGGVFFDRIQGNPTMGQIVNPPTIYTPTQYYGTFADIAETAKSGLLSPTGSITSLGGKGEVQTVYNFSLSVQRQIARTTVAEVSYVGSLGRHLLWQRNINPVPLGSNFLGLHPENRDPTGTAVLSPNFLRPYQGLGDVLLYEFAATSNYNSLQASLSHRFRRGLNFGVSYTFSKALDTADSYSNAVDPFLDPRHRNYGPAGFDRPQVFSANYRWALPKFRSLRRITENWELTGITRFQSGSPYTPGFSLVSGVDVTGSTSASTRPNVKDPHAPAIADRFGPIVIGTTQPTVPMFGNAGKNILSQPGIANFDMSLSKNFRIAERINSTFRFETYNTFNHTQFSSTDNTLRFDAKAVQINPLFGEPTAARAARRIQLSLRLSF